MPGTGARIVKAIEQAWADIRANHDEVPDVVVVTGSGFAQKGAAKWAHFWANRWNEQPEEPAEAPASRKPELFVAGELLKLGGRRIMETLIHEAGHGLNFARGEQGTNVNGRHNMVFVKAATELGNHWPEGKKPHKTIGFSQVEITDETAEKYADTIAALESARLAYLVELKQVTAGGEGGDGDDGGTTTKGGGRGSRGGRTGAKRINAICGCEEPDPFPITPGRLARRPILCGECKEPFRHPEVDDDEDA